MISIENLPRRLAPIAAILGLLVGMDATWVTMAEASPTAQTAADPDDGERPTKKPTNLTGKLNLNTATELQLMMLPTVGPAKADRVVAWRKKNGGFKRVADLRRVKGFGYKTFKRLEPYLDIRGDTTLASR